MCVRKYGGGVCGERVGIYVCVCGREGMYECMGGGGYMGGGIWEGRGGSMSMCVGGEGVCMSK